MISGGSASQSRICVNGCQRYWWSQAASSAVDGRRHRAAPFRRLFSPQRHRGTEIACLQVTSVPRCLWVKMGGWAVCSPRAKARPPRRCRRRCASPSRWRGGARCRRARSAGGCRARARRARAARPESAMVAVGVADDDRHDVARIVAAHVVAAGAQPAAQALGVAPQRGAPLGLALDDGQRRGRRGDDGRRQRGGEDEGARAVDQEVDQRARCRRRRRRSRRAPCRACPSARRRDRRGRAPSTSPAPRGPSTPVACASSTITMAS